jgi:hypothetical protein
MNNLKVLRIDNKITDEWILNKHYAKRKCSRSYCFGLFENDILVGVCTFGFPPNYMFNNGKCVFNTYRILTLELNRLITNDDLPKNTLSFFVSQSLKQLPQPCCIVSYADPNSGHYGYIYQATNWIFTGDSTPKHKYHFADGSSFDIRRGIDQKIIQHGEVVRKEKLIPTQRYLYVNANKRDKKRIINDIKMNILPYPKGINRNYDTTYECNKIMVSDIIEKQGELFTL